jgi:hypothetical protein
MRILLVGFLAFLIGVAPARAASVGDFSVRAQMEGDERPPTTPTLLTAIPVAPSQIDITWSPSTDDSELLGYTVSRDGQHIATTTLTSYSDTGLTARTTYTYTVRAFDWLYNISSSSNELVATTPNPSSGDTASGKLMVRGAVEVAPGLTTATLAWSTSRPSRFALRWGRTPSYELGYIVSDRFRENHETTITDLLPSTKYYYEVTGYNTVNDISQPIGSGIFITSENLETQAPPNVRNLFVVAEGVSARLSWDNPLLTAGSYSVRIVRNHLGYPLDPYDGMVVYQGNGTAYKDEEALVRHPRQYYTVYVIDTQGRWSSGALALVTTKREVTPVPEPFLPPPASGGVPVSPPTISLPTLSFSDIVLTQGDVRYDFTVPEITLRADAAFSITIPQETLPSRLKSIIVTLLDPTDYSRAHRFLLRRNDAGTAYEATLAPVGKTGVTQLLIEVYDLETMVVGRYGKQITFTASAVDAEPVVFPDVFMKGAVLPGSLLAVSVLSGFLLWWARRRREDNV